jgi:hypothetical protein
MPALFAYLIAVALLLGGGYGALSWLAAPEPVKVAVKEKPKLPSRDEAKLEARSSDTKSSEASSPEASAFARNDSDRAASGPLASGPSQPSSPQAGPAAATEQGAQATGPGAQMAASQPSEPAQDHQDAPANTEMARAEIDQPVETPSQAVAPAPPASQQSALSPATLAKAVRQRHPRSGRSEKPGIEKSGLAVMTLRTIEFPDGRRVTRLIPYRSAPYRSARASTFDPYE